ncbi:MAG: hypothetical protein UDQ92_09385 [Lachnospiraceae bacterium]|jgi:hypothetical protein|nr:hypothetical protein [Lachnospiraceae bacterium]CDA69134.1 uncharacterized protein BN687_01075 [Clostridium sp. CAG:510]
MFTMAGTIKRSVRMAALDQKWQQKKNSFGQDKKKLTEMTAEERQLQDFREQAEQMRKSQKHANIDAKLAAGEELTPEEIEYLRQNNPQALKDYEDTQRERENYKRALRNCRTKEEVERLKYTKMGQFMAEAKKISSNACIPKGKKVALLKRILQQATAVEDEHKEFLKTSRYASLPTEEEAREAEKAEKEQREAETTGADETENTEEVKDTDAEDAEDVKDSDAEGTKDTGAESADHTKKTPLPNTPEFPQDTRRKKKPQPAGSLPEGSAAIHSILTSVVASADGIPGEINVKI